MAFAASHNSRTAPDWIPSERFAPVLREWIEHQEKVNGSGGGAYVRGEDGRHGVRSALCERANVSPRAVWRYLSGESKYVRLDIADRLLCAMDLTYLWYTEFEDLYFAGLESELEEAA